MSPPYMLYTDKEVIGVYDDFATGNAAGLIAAVSTAEICQLDEISEERAEQIRKKLAEKSLATKTQ